MRRAGRRCGALLFAGLLVACGGGDDGGGPPTTGTGPTSSTPGPTLPADVEPGTGWLAIEGDPVDLEVTSCSDDDAAGSDPTAQKLFELVATGTPDGDEITVTATEFRSTSDDGTAVTQTVTITSQVGEETVGIEARRSFFGERWLDLTDPAVDEPLFDPGPDVVVEANFGPQGSREGDPGIAPGALVGACPTAAGG